MTDVKYISGHPICDVTAREQAEQVDYRISAYEDIFTSDVSESVQAWLDEHPEATTTVQDGSLTYKKLVTGTLGYVTPEMFGAKGDGITDDTAAIKSAIASGHPIYFPDGTYIVSQSLFWCGVCIVEMSSKATIKAQSGISLPYLIAIRNDGASYDLEKDSIAGGVFDGNGSCDIVIAINYTRGCIANSIIKNAKTVGLYIRHNITTADRGNGSLCVNNVRFINDTLNLGTVGVYSGGTDDSLSCVITKDFETGFNVGAGTKIDRCHSWISFSDLYENSVAFVLRGTGCLLNGCVSDTMRYGFKTIADYARITAVNLSFYINVSVIESEILAEFPYVVFDLFSNKTLLSVTNFDAGFSNLLGKILSDNAINISSIKFVNLNLQNALNVSNVPYDISAHKVPASYISVLAPSGNIVLDTLNNLENNSVASGYISLPDLNIGGFGTIITTKANGGTIVQTIIVKGKGSYVRRKANGQWNEFS